MMSGARETGNRRYRYNRPEEEDGYKTMRSEEFKEDLKAADAVTRLLDGYDELRMSYAGAIYAEDKRIYPMWDHICKGSFAEDRISVDSSPHLGPDITDN